MLAERGLLTEMACGSNFAYVLSSNADFLATEYKVLQSQANSCFVRCMRMSYNGKVQLYYLINGCKPLSSLLESLEVENFLTIVTNLLGCIIDVKNNGFLACQNIDISLERIYVDPATYKVSLVYLPLRQRLHARDSIFENELRTALVKVISKTPSLNSARILQLSEELSNGMLNLEELRGRLRVGAGRGTIAGGGGYAQRRESMSGILRQLQQPAEFGESVLLRPSGAGTLRLVALNAPERVEISVSRSAFVLGRSAAGADGVISFNQKIGRRHCRIDLAGQRFTVTDLHSTNGTKINGFRLEPELPQPLKNGDILRLADSDFQIVIG